MQHFQDAKSNPTGKHPPPPHGRSEQEERVDLLAQEMQLISNIPILPVHISSPIPSRTPSPRVNPLSLKGLLFSHAWSRPVYPMRIIWISRHFGYGPSNQRKSTAPSPAKNWYTSLIMENARRQGSFNPYGNLDGIAFTIPALLLVEAFLEALILVFGDWFMKENAKRALSACKQGTSTIGEYNSCFSSLVYLVEDVEEACIKQYVSGLNPQIILQAMSKEWRHANTLDARMELATEAAAQLDLLSLLPSDSNHTPCQCHFSSAPPPGLSFSPPHQTLPFKDPNAMEIDTAFVRRGAGGLSLMDMSRAIFRQRNLCFRCLKPTNATTHTGSLDFPNAAVSCEQHKAFVTRQCQQTTTTVSAVHTSSPPKPPNFLSSLLLTSTTHLPPKHQCSGRGTSPFSS
ncbi:hypothetical protein PCANC_24004 [Puccinia coronata f. sp. avenae]|uniref:Retrotransposon gag domain-containing protein n=1 Tax=Puccinia coronata f. sp. avenae TaxID=200324 RepID=A0A2N5TS94_9BASI|nr:hypothetical protein PCANC_24004 [Puccinia coronata f. sp. avenae]